MFSHTGRVVRSLAAASLREIKSFLPSRPDLVFTAGAQPVSAGLDSVLHSEAALLTSNTAATSRAVSAHTGEEKHPIQVFTINQVDSDVAAADQRVAVLQE